MAGLCAQLAQLGKPERAVAEKRYLKSDLVHYGVPVPVVRKVVRAQVRNLSHDEVVSLVQDLWRQPVHECRLAAAIALAERAAVLSVADAQLLTELIRQARTWALVDVLVPRPLAQLNAADPVGTTVVLDRWVADQDFWLRRAALLAHLKLVATDDPQWDRFTGYADDLLTDQEFFVRKAIGWVLRETARRRPEDVQRWLAPRTDRISGVALREAVKPLPESDRDRLLAAYRAGTTAVLPAQGRSRDGDSEEGRQP